MRRATGQVKRLRPPALRRMPYYAAESDDEDPDGPPYYPVPPHHPELSSRSPVAADAPAVVLSDAEVGAQVRRAEDEEMKLKRMIGRNRCILSYSAANAVLGRLRMLDAHQFEATTYLRGERVPQTLDHFLTLDGAMLREGDAIPTSVFGGISASARVVRWGRSRLIELNSGLR